MFDNIKHEVNVEVAKVARANIVRKLKKQGIEPESLLPSEFHELVADEAKILAHDTKKVGLGLGIGVALSLVFGF